MAARIIDGAALAAAARDDVRTDVDRMRIEHERVPGLAVIIVGEHPASQVYVRTKGRAATEAGIRSLEYRLPMQVRETEVLALLRGVGPMTVAMLLQNTHRCAAATSRRSSAARYRRKAGESQRKETA